MKRLLLGSLLLVTVSALHLKSDALHLDSPETNTNLGQDLESSGEQEGELALIQKATQSAGEEASRYQDTFEDEEESDPTDLDENVQCPREEDTVQLQGSLGCKTCRYLLVRTPRRFRRAQRICRRCYRGYLISIHNFSFNSRVQTLAKGVNQGQIWIGGILKGCLWWKRFRWTDGSRWDFGYWAAGQPGNGGGHCVALCTRGGHWRRAPCRRRLPFVCSF
ncbi:proteoglycan 3 [Tupaia chinensis]|uniref:proteoglycan 3 n=1 Tax=Tupaia chinensis TaxID=246437 RepID=UPI000FFCB58B|nr:proteoglycan 3 [Tupaia chinensis]